MVLWSPLPTLTIAFYLTHILIKATTSHLTLTITLTLSPIAATTFTLSLALTGSVTFTITLIAATSHHQAITLTPQHVLYSVRPHLPYIRCQN